MENEEKRIVQIIEEENHGIEVSEDREGIKRSKQRGQKKKNRDS